MIKNLQSLRFVFCMLIFVLHFTGMVHTEYNFAYGGDAGVAFFFMLSGFVLCIGYSRKNESKRVFAIDFFLGRLRKLYPLHLVSMLIAVAMFLHIGNTFHIDYFVAQLLMIQSWFASTDYILYGNPVSWFLGPLFLCYALFPWLYGNVIRKPASFSFRCLLVIYVIGYTGVRCISDADIDNYLYAFPPLRIMDFFIGMITYRLYKSTILSDIRQRVIKLSVSWATLVESLVIGLCFSTWVVYPYLPSWFRFSALFWIPFSITILWFSLSDGGKGVFSRLFRNRSMLWLGGISFEIYMLHIIGIMLSNAVYGKLFGYDNMNLPVLFAFAVITTVMLSALAKKIEKEIFCKLVDKKKIEVK